MARPLQIGTFEGLNGFGASSSPPAMSQAAKDTWNSLMSQGFSGDVVNGVVVWTPSLPMMVRADLRAEIESAILGGWGLAGDDLIQAHIAGGGKKVYATTTSITGSAKSGALDWKTWLGIAAFVALCIAPWGEAKGKRKSKGRR